MKSDGNRDDKPPARKLSTVSNRSNASSVETSERDRQALKFFRQVVGQRNNDNRPVPLPQQVSAGDRYVQSNRGTMEIAGDLSPSNSTNRNFFQACRCCASCSVTRSDCELFFGSLINSCFWKSLMQIFTFVLLFGNEIRDLWVPDVGDPAVDVIFCIAFGFFVLDIFIRIGIEPNYFKFNISCNRQRAQNKGSGAGCSYFQIGSFLFWCDVLSASMLLLEISFIPVWLDETKEIFIWLGPTGKPINKSFRKGASRTLYLSTRVEEQLLVTVLKTARMARTIRSSAALKISSKIYWCGIINLLNPMVWVQYCSRRRQVRRSIYGMDDFSRYSSAASPGERRASWSAVTLEVLAIVRADAMEKEERNKSFFARNSAKVLRFIGIRRCNDEIWLRQVAATKIQRVWRAALHRRKKESVLLTKESKSNPDVAWRRSLDSKNPIEQALQQRSFLLAYSSQNIEKTRKQTTRHGSSEEVEAVQPSNRRSIISYASSQKTKIHNESQIGNAMNELTGQRVALGVLIMLFFAVLFTPTYEDTTRENTMVVLHTQTSIAEFANESLEAARKTAIPDLYQYTFANGYTRNFYLSSNKNATLTMMRPSDKLVINITGSDGSYTVGKFDMMTEENQVAILQFLSTIFILLIWFWGVIAFAGPVMILVVTPIERMVRLLGMLMVDPLGYQSTSRYKRFVAEEDEITKNTPWTSEVLKGMETEFLMSTILRIGSLLKVGFGSAGAEIIRNNLQKGETKNVIVLGSQGTTVSCIFLFSDIRRFTDITECLQEEVFVFTNKIAAVVHSICHSYGGAANNYEGDAFFLSWLLDEDDSRKSLVVSGEDFAAKNHQADKALLSVVKICIALEFDDYYVDSMSKTAHASLLATLAGRKGPIVQMGMGLHAGKAVQGAIGSEQKIDAIYISEAVKRTDFLEASTKKYGVQMLMSGTFHRLLSPATRRRCRKVDQILIRSEDDEDEDDNNLDKDIMELFTFDMDIKALWKNPNKKISREKVRQSDSSEKGFIREGTKNLLRRRSHKIAAKDPVTNDRSEAFEPKVDVTENDDFELPQLVLPTGPALYSSSVWRSGDIKTIRQTFAGLDLPFSFFQMFNQGLKAFYNKEWEHAKQNFVAILEKIEDGPSRYFLSEIEKNNGIPPPGFKGYGEA